MIFSSAAQCNFKMKSYKQLFCYNAIFEYDICEKNQAMKKQFPLAQIAESKVTISKRQLVHLKLF